MKAEPPKMVFIDGSGERWHPIDMRITTFLQSERGLRVAVDQRTMDGLAVEIDGRRVRDLSQAKAACT